MIAFTSLELSSSKVLSSGGTCSAAGSSDGSGLTCTSKAWQLRLLWLDNISLSCFNSDCYLLPLYTVVSRVIFDYCIRILVHVANSRMIH